MSNTISLTTISAKVIPKSRATSVEVLEATPGRASLKVKVRAVPEDGKANEEVIRAIADYFGVPKNKISIKSGHTSRNKVLLADIDISKLSVQLPLC